MLIKRVIELHIFGLFWCLFLDLNQIIQINQAWLQAVCLCKNKSVSKKKEI